MNASAVTAQRRPRRRGPLWVMVAVALIGAWITVVLVRQQAAGNRAHLQRALQEQAARLTQDVVTRWDLFQYGIRGARGVFVSRGTETVPRERFEAYARSRDVDAEFPGARGFGFIRRVPVEREADFLARAREDGMPDFQIKQLAPHDGERFVIEFIEPVERNRQAVGLDIASEARRRAAAVEAMRTGQAQLTAPITIVQASGRSQQAFLLLMPVYRPGMPRATPEERERAVYGWAYAPLVSIEVLEKIGLGLDALTLRISDTTESDDGDVFFEAGAEPPVSVARMQHVVFGRTWSFEVGATPAFVARQNLLSPSVVAGAGAVTTAVVALALALVMLLAQRRRDLARHRAAQAALVDNASDPIIATDAAGRVESWNQAAATMLGFSADEALGQTLAALVGVRQDQSGEVSTLPPGDHVWRCKDGSHLEVAVTTSNVPGPDGTMAGQAHVVRDIGLRKARERELQAANRQLEVEVGRRTGELVRADRRLRTVVDALPSLISSWDSDLRCRMVNQAHADFLGREPPSLIGGKVADVLPDVLFGIDREVMQRAMAGESTVVQRELPQPGGAPPRHLQIHCIPERSDAGDAGLVLVAHDVSEAVRGRQALQRALDDLQGERHRMETVLGINGVGTWEWEIASGTIRLDERWHALLGYVPGELDRHIDQRVALSHPQDLTGERDALGSHLAGKTERYEHESRLRHKDGRWRWMLDRGRVTEYDADGRAVRMLGTLLDIEGLKAAQQRVADNEDFLAHVAHVAGVGGWQYDIANQDLKLSAEARRICGLGDDEMLTLDDLAGCFDGPAQQTVADALRGAVGQGEAFDMEQPLRPRAGAAEVVRIVAEAVGAPGGNALSGDHTRLVGAIKDATARHREAEALRAARKAAEGASAAKSAFLANMSHEIRTPLNALLGVGELLADTPLDDDQRHLVTRSQMAGRALIGIVNDVLDLAKIEAGEMSLDLSAFRPEQLVYEITSVHGSAATTKGLRLRTAVDPMMPTWLVGDPDRLRQIAGNLVGNAIKFTAEGTVTLDVGMTTIDGSPALRLTVSDSGIGISADDQARLFQPFVQADASTTRRFGGSGLGLSIVRRLAHMMDGEVELESEPGRGSTFVVTVRVQAADEEALRSLEADHDSIEVVVVEDHEDDRMQVMAMARRLGWRAHEFGSGQELLGELQRRVEAQQPLPDALLMDWQLPGMDGLLTLETLSATLGATASLPATLVLTAHDSAVLRAGSEAAHVDRILVKPVNASDLFNAVNSSVARGTGDTSRVIRSTRFDLGASRWLAGMRLLLVDDNDINREVGRRLMEREGALVETCVDGAQCLARLARGPQDFDAVLMDVQMPVLDGLEATRRLRADPALRETVVIALTAGALVEERKRAMEAGVDDFVTKPLVPQGLVATLRAHVERRRGRPLPVMPMAARDDAGVDGWPQVEGIDAARARVSTGGDLELFLKVLARLCAAAEFRDLEAMAHDRADVAARMHKLRGSAGTVGAVALLDAAAAAEEAARLPDAALEGLVHHAACLLEALRQAAAPVLAAARPPAPDGGAGAAVDPAALQGLIRRLRARDLGALRDFDALAPALATHADDAALSQVQGLLAVLDFEAAAAGLEALVDRHQDLSPGADNGVRTMSPAGPADAD